MRFLADLAWRDLRASGRSLWVFCACLVLGVTLVTATGGLYRLVNLGLLADTRLLLGGDLEVDADEPLPAAVLEWMEAEGDVSLVRELDTMLGTEDGEFLRVELQVMDERYPLYGAIELEPEIALSEATGLADGAWGVAVDAILAERLGLGLGDVVYIGELEMPVRALVLSQPDRSLNADWRGAPVLLAAGALDASGLLGPGSRIDYDYRVRTDTPAEAWRNEFYAAFPAERWEVRTFRDRGRRIADRLGQIASGLLIIGFSTLFIGGLGVFNSIQAYLQAKLETIATLRALGLRNRRLALVYLLQIGMLAGLASLAGAAVGSTLGVAGAMIVAERVPIATAASNLAAPALTGIGFGVLTAYAFALPAIGRALAVEPAILFRGSGDQHLATPAGWWSAALACAAVIVALVLATLPDPAFGAGFVIVTAALLVLLDLIVRGLRRGARALDDRSVLAGRFALRLAVANLHRPGTPLRASLLSLGSALTLLVACTLVVASLVRALDRTIPEEAPALVLYDIGNDRVDDVVGAIRSFNSTARVDTTPLVRARIVGVNGRSLEAYFGDDRERRRDASQDQYKLSYSANNIDAVTLQQGEWWTEPVEGMPLIAFEDREAAQLGVGPGDTLTFEVEGSRFDARVAAIYGQKGIQTKFWFEGILSDGALEPFVYRHVGAAYMDDDEAIAAQRHVAAVAPTVITVRTAALLTAAREILGKAAAGLAVVAGVSLAASLLVLVSVMAAGRARQVYDATVLHSLGTRLAVIRRSLHFEFTLLAIVTSAFAVILGSAIAVALLHLRLKLPSDGLLWLGAVTAAGVSGVSLAFGARYLLRRLKPRPAELLRGG